MNKWLTITAGIVGGVGLGIILAVVIIENLVRFCPVCSGRLIVEEDSATCTSCGIKLKFEKIKLHHYLVQIQNKQNMTVHPHLKYS